MEKMGEEKLTEALKEAFPEYEIDHSDDHRMMDQEEIVEMMKLLMDEDDSAWITGGDTVIFRSEDEYHIFSLKRKCEFQLHKKGNRID